MNTFQLHILAADKNFCQGECEYLIFPTLDGLVSIHAHHSDMIVAVVPGELQYKLAGDEEKIASVSEGLLKVEHNDVLILVDSAERPEDIDAIRAQIAADTAREELLQKKSIEEYKFVQSQLARAINRLRVKDHYFGKSNM